MTTTAPDGPTLRLVQEPTTRSRHQTVQPERLLARGGLQTTPDDVDERTTRRARIAAGAARSLVLRLLRRMTADQLVVVEHDGTTHRFGPSDGTLSATITVRDVRAWTAVATEGSIGFGRGYIEGWWSTDDPVTVVRVAIRNLGGLDEFRNRFAASAAPVADTLRRRILPRPGRRNNKDDIASHYDLGNDFFALFLDETMTYSAGVFASPATSMAEASLAKYDRLLDKIDVGADDELLEIGTGWGGMALRAAGHRGARVTTTTLSKRQHDEATTRVADAGLEDRVELLTSDWRDLHGRYDRIVSIEMIEAVDWRDYERFFATIERCLRPDGLVGIQAICVPDRRYHRTRNTEDFIRRFIFPGGMLPSIGAVTSAVSSATRLQLLDVEDFTGHYAETLQRWRTRFDERSAEVTALGLDDRFARLWRFYLAYCEAGFRERHCTVNQFVLAGPAWRGEPLSLRPH